MKGAALLLNLKDQNSTLIQMLMEKNQHIKRLANEIKTAKLYARTNKTEPYRLEISRLRNLLLQSQEVRIAHKGVSIASRVIVTAGLFSFIKNNNLLNFLWRLAKLDSLKFKHIFLTGIERSSAGSTRALSMPVSWIEIIFGWNHT